MRVACLPRFLAVLTAFAALSHATVAAQSIAPRKISTASGIAIDRLDDLDSFGESVGTMGDFDADGIADIVVGAPRDDDGGVNRGAVWLLMLNADGTVKGHRKISSTRGGLGDALDDFDFFGAAAAAIGDVDGDGVTDLAVGAPRDDDGANTPNANRGAVWILFLREDGTVREHQKISDTEGGLSASFSDQDIFGSAVASAGDFDGDGVVDLFVGSPGEGGANRGAVWLLLLQRDGTVKSHQKISGTEGNFTGVIEEFDNFGASVAAVGDLDGDGITELAVGAFGDDDESTAAGYEGAVWILFLESDGRVKRHQKISDNEGGLSASLGNGDRFGSSVASLGDVDGDGTADLAVGAAERGGRGAVFLLLLQNDGTVKSELSISHLSSGFGAVGEGAMFGGAVRGLADIDGDGVHDLLVGAHLDSEDGLERGAVWVLMLDDDGRVRRYQRISNTSGGFTSTVDRGDRFGQALVSLGDLDGDGAADMAVGAPRDDDGGIDRGAVWVLLLHPDGGVKTHRKISQTEGGFTGELDDFDFFGSALATIGDLDGDGVTDLAVGAARDDDGTDAPNANSGAVWILFLRSDGSVKRQQKISGTEGGFSGVVDEQNLFGHALARIDDFDGDGVGDLLVGAPGDGGSNRGALWLLSLHGDGTVKSHRKIAPGESGFDATLDEFDNFGGSVASLGDLDGDGISEMVVGAHGDDDGSDDSTSYRGAVWILYPASNGSVRRHLKISATAETMLDSVTNGGRFGSAVASLGDLDGDAVPELAVGAEGDESVWILFLRADGTIKDLQSIPSAGSALGDVLDENDRFGSALARMDRLGRESSPLFAVGAPGNDDESATVSDGFGAAWLLYDVPFPPPRVELLGVASGRPTVSHDVTLSARIAAVSGVSDVTVGFRRGGDLEFFRGTMRERDTDVYEFTIPAFAASPLGIEYFVTATNVDGVETRAPSNGVVSLPLFVGDGLSAPLVHGNASDAYRLISVPLYLEDSDARSMLEDDLGRYARTRWRFFGQADDGGLAELESADLSIDPGKGYWLLVGDEGRTLTTGPGTTVATDRPFEIVLKPGWNLIGSPFTFPVPWPSVLRSGRPVDMRAYRGEWTDADELLKPLTGYAVFNNQGVLDTLALDPQLSVDDEGSVGAAPAGKASEVDATRAGTTSSVDATHWSIRIVARRGRARDADNLAVAAAGASGAWDRFDRPEPPLIGDYVAVSFPHAEWGDGAARLSMDARPLDEPVHRWDFDVRTPQPERVELDFEGIDGVPSEKEVWLVDEFLKTRVDLRDDPVYVVMSGDEPRRLSLVVGTGTLMGGALGEEEELPVRSGLGSIYPNPFSSAVTVRYGLAQAGSVRLEAFDVLGRRVATLAAGRMDAGRHAVVWDGRSDAGAPLAPGLYVIRLGANLAGDARQIVLVR